MSKYRDSWYPIVARVASNYPEYKLRHEEAQTQSVTASLSGMPHSGRVTRKTEEAALRELPPREQQELDAIERTITTILRQRDGREVMAIVEMVDFRRTHSLYGAAENLHMSYNTAKRRRKYFLHTLAKNLGYK